MPQTSALSSMSATFASKAYASLGADEVRKRALKTAQDFEASFLSQMFKPMFEGLKTDGAFGGGSAELYLDDEADVLAACARRGIRAAALSTYWSAVAAGDAQQGVVIGYGHLPEPRLRAALAALADALSECASSDAASTEHRTGNATGTTG